MPWSNKRILALSLLVFSGLAVAGETRPLASPTLSADTEVATAGFFRLSWSLPEPAATDAGIETRFELQQAPSAAFAHPHVVYTGPDRASTFSGFENGDYYFRVRNAGGDADSPWSAVTEVRVRHHPLERALLFFALGALVFLATLVLILRGPSEERRP